MEEHLNTYRRRRNFLPKKYLHAKIWLLNEYMRKTGLSTCIVGVSGGIDSAVTLGIIKCASNEQNSPIKRIVAGLMPEFVTGTTNQSSSVSKGINLVNQLNDVYGVHGTHGVKCIPIETRIIDLTNFHNYGIKSIPTLNEISPWTSGQLVSYIRTPMLYHLASILYEEGFPSIVVGTTNFDEIGYIGYFGKASDGTVDVQLISDLHKSEVFTLSLELNIPNEIICAPPSGDLYTGETDNEYIGTTYDSIELYMGHLMGNSTIPTDGSFDKIRDRIEHLHSQCVHKYFGPGYALHLNLYDVNIPGGLQIIKKYNKPSINYDNFINYKQLYVNLTKDIVNINSTNKDQFKFYDVSVSERNKITLIENILPKSVTTNLFQQINTHEFIPVGIDGYKKNYKNSDHIGSYRLSFYDDNFAEYLWKKVKLTIDPYYYYTDDVSTDFHPTRVYRPIGINPLMRVIKYHDSNNCLVAHYDAPYDFKDGRKTLMSMVIYLTNNIESGHTRFLQDDQEHISINKRNLYDKKTVGDSHNVLYEFSCIEGNAAIFNHRILHDAAPVENELKMIIRTDIVFEECLPYKLSMTNPLNFTKPIQDPYYAYALKHYSHDVLKESGLTNYSRSIELNNNWLSTPLSKIITRVKLLQNTYGENYLSKPLYVLVNTGCYDPIHSGHVQMMEKAYGVLNRNMIILGGYLVPSHQSYVDEKSGLPDKYKRLMKCYEFTENHDWLGIDPFELLYENADVNFTDILSRLKGYISHHLNMEVNPIYVFGSDHPEFTRLFGDYGYACCVKRGGYEKQFEEFKNSFNHRPNIFWIDSPTNIMSSTIIKSNGFVYDPIIPKDGIFQLRRENFNLDGYDEFCDNIGNIFTKYIPNNRIVFVDAYEQKKLLQNEQFPLISLDPVIPGDYNIQISRLFELSTPFSQMCIVPRPGEPSLHNQIKIIPNGEYTLFDDDSVTMSTINFAKSLFLPEIKINKTMLLTDKTNRIDISDCRDFMVGAPYSGLVITLPNGAICRAPYALPYVFPSDRSTVPVGHNKDFSVDIWKLNKDYYSSHKDVLLKDVDLQTQKFMKYIGFTLQHPMMIICEWHLNYLTNVWPDK